MQTAFDTCLYLQAVQKTQKPIQTANYITQNGFAMPSVLLCSFGQYDLDSFEAEYPTLYAGNWELFHMYEDLLTPGLTNNSQSFAQAPPVAVNEAKYTSSIFGQNDLVTFTQNPGDCANKAHNGLPHLSRDAAGQCNFSTPQLMGLVRSAAINASNAIEQYNGLLRTRWCIMWSPYRLTLDHPSDVSSPDAAISIGSAANRQLDSRQVWRVAVNLNGTAIMEDQAWQNVMTDENGGPVFARTLSVKLIDFAGNREQEWHNDSLSSQFLREVLETGDPDAFQLVSLDHTTTLSVQKTGTTTLSRLQKLGWPWAPWPWSDTSPYEVSSRIANTTAFC